MTEFKQNDEMLEQFMKDVIKVQLDTLQDKTKKIGEAIGVQSELLDKANAKAEKTESTL